MRHLAPSVLAAILLLQPEPTQAGSFDPLTVRDAVNLASYAAAVISPDQRWALVERRERYASARRFDTGRQTWWTLSSIYRIDLDHPTAPPVPVLKMGDGRGVFLGPSSSNGLHVVVYAFDGDRLELGVLDTRSGATWWTGLTPAMPVAGASATWAGIDMLVAAVRPDGSLPPRLRWDGGAQVEIAARWGRMANGDAPSKTVIETEAGVASAGHAEASRRIVILDPQDQTVATVAEGAIGDFEVSPDGRNLAVRIEVPRRLAPAAATLVQGALEHLGRLQLIDLRDGTSTSLKGREVAPHLLRWSPDSRRVLVWTRRDGEGWADGGLIGVAADGQATQYEMDQLDPMEPGREVDELRGVRADWLDGHPMIFARRRGGSRFDWWRVGPDAPPRALTGALQSPPAKLSALDGNEALLFADGSAWKITPTGVAKTAHEGLSDAMPPSLMTPLRLRINTPPARSWTVGRSANDHLVWFGSAVGEAPGPADCGTLAILAVQTHNALAVCRVAGVETLLLLRAGESPRVIETLNGDMIGKAYVAARRVDHLDADGVPVESWLYMPPDGLPPKGLIVMVYPGTPDDGRYLDANTLIIGLNPSLLATEGYAVLSPHLASTSGADRFERFVSAADLAIDAALATETSIPKDRIALLGHSFGAYAVLGMATRSRRYKSIVAWAGFSDLFGQWGEFGPLTRAMPGENLMIADQMGAVEVGQAALGGPPWRAVDEYVAGSPFLSAAAITAPTLLITADRDFVPMSQSERMFTALHRQGRRARIVSYWGEGHFNWSPANIIDLYGEIGRWLDDTLLGEKSDALMGVASPIDEPSSRTPPAS